MTSGKHSIFTLDYSHCKGEPILPDQSQLELDEDGMVLCLWVQPRPGFGDDPVRVECQIAEDDTFSGNDGKLRVTGTLDFAGPDDIACDDLLRASEGTDPHDTGSFVGTEER